jgi:ubiquinone/menaquinone biosynthesis C-methylase UbiE
VRVLSSRGRRFDRWLTSLLDERNDDSTARHYRCARLAFQTELADRSPLAHVLDIAAGTGRLAELYLPFASSAVLLDTSAESLGLAADRPRNSTPSPTFVEADIFAWDPAGQTFDTIIFSAWLHHVPHRPARSMGRAGSESPLLAISETAPRT